MEQNSTEPLTNEQRLSLLDQKVDYLVKQARAGATARKITIIVTIIFVVLPAILMLFILPSVIGSITSSYSI